MPSQFLERQLDYIFFFYGLAFLLLAAICAVMRQPAARRLPWRWLAGFGLLHGINEWLDMLALSFGDNRLFEAGRLAVMAASFLCLVEFGRVSLSTVSENRRGCWIYLPLLACASCGILAGPAGLNATIRLTLGLLGGLWAAYAMARAAQVDLIARRPLMVAAIAMACYAIATGLITPTSTFFPASVLNHASFFAWTGIPIQLVRGCLAILITAAIWRYHQQLSRNEFALEMRQCTESPYGLQLVITIMFVLIVGRTFTEAIGYNAEEDARLQLSVLAKTLAAGINPERIPRSLDAPFDPNTADSIRLREQVAQMQTADPEFRGLHVTVQQNGTFVCIADSFAEHATHAHPGMRDDQRWQEVQDVFATGQPSPVSLYRDSQGTFFSAFAPIRDPSTGQVVAVIGLDVDSRRCQRTLSQYRMMPIGMVLMVSVVAIVFFVSRQRMWERAQHVALSEQRLADAQRVARIGSWTHDLRTNHMTWSEEMYRICGCDPQTDTPSPTSLHDHLGPAERFTLHTATQDILQDGKGYEVELHVKRSDGTVRHVLAKTLARFGDDGKAIQLVGTLQDITDRKQAEIELRKLTFAVEQSPAVIVVTDVQGNIQYANPKFTQVTGYTLDEARGQNPRILKGGKTLQQEYKLLWDTILAGGEWRGEFYNRKKNGDYYWERALIAPITDSDGTITHFMAIKEDITAQKQMEATLRSTEERQRLFANNVTDVIWTTDLAGVITYASPSLRHQLGYESDDVVGQDYSRLLTRLSLMRAIRYYKKSLAAVDAGRRVQGGSLELEFLRKDGTHTICEMTYSGVYDASGTIIGFQGISHDISERKRIQGRLAVDEARLESLLRISLSKADLIQELLDLALNEAISLTHSKIGYIYHYDEQRQLFTLNSWSKNVMKECTVVDAATTYALQKTGIWGEAVRQRKPILLDNYESSSPLKKGYPAGHVPLTTFLTIPVFMQERIVAVVGVANKESAYDQSDIRQLTLLMDSVWNIASRKRAEDDLRQSTEKLRLHVEQSSLAVIEWDTDFHVSLWNPAAERIFGYTAAEAAGRPISFLVPSEALPTIRHLLERMATERCNTDSTNENVTKDGRIIVCKWHNTPLVSADGKFLGAVSLGEDVTERTRAELALHVSQTKYRTLYDSSADAIMLLVPGEKFASANPATLALFGCGDAEEFYAQTPTDLSPKHQPDGSLSADKAHEMMAIAMQKGSHAFEWKHKRMDGCEFFATVLLTRMELEGRSILQATVRDITALKDAHHALEETNLELQRANTVKSQFLATMSHEIRTPLNAIIGMTGMLLDTKLDSEQKDCSETIRTSGEVLLALITDILDFSKLEAEKMELENQPFDLLRCVEDAIGLLSPTAVEKNLNLAYEIEGELPWCYVGDVTRLRQILANLLSNAVKFTDSGEVVVTISSEEHFDDHYELHFAVRDTGIGVPPDFQDRLFQSFSQLDAASNRRFGGTGLGLAISKRLCELMDGRMWVESTGIPGEGATFHFSIHAAKAADQTLSDDRMAERIAGLAGMTLLIVDSHKASRSTLVTQAKRWAMRATAVSSGEKALDLLRRGSHFDLAILDMEMPSMNGLQLAATIKNMPANRAIPLVLISPLTHQMTESETAWFAARLAKPIKASHLSEAFCTALGKPADTRQGESPSETGTEPVVVQPNRLRVLLAEDNPINQKVALKMLMKIGYRADVVSNGIEALQAFQQISYDVILMDCQMPEVDGYEATRQIRMFEHEQQRPPVHIIAMTANVMQGDREQCLEAGMDDYLGKPVRSNDLQALLQQCRPITPSECDTMLIDNDSVQLESTSLSASSAREQTTVIKSTTVEQIVMEPEAPPLDIELLDENAEIGLDGLQELLDMYFVQADEILAALRTAIDSGDSDQVNRLAHKLAGSSAVCGIAAMVTPLREIEMCGREARLSDADSLLALTTTRLDLCRRLLGEYMANRAG